jgi:outer membrane protein TolC
MEESTMTHSFFGGGVAAPSGSFWRQTAPPSPGARFWGRLLVCCLLALGGAGLFAQEAAAPAGPAAGLWKLSANGAVELAIKNNLSLESGRVTLDTKKRKSELVWNQFLPTVGLSGTMMRDNWASVTQGISIPPFVSSPSITLPQWHLNGTLQASYDFSFALVEGIRNIRLDYEAGLVGLEKARAQLERDVRKSYYQMLLLEEQLALLRENYAAAERRVAMAEANYRAARAPELTWLQARVAMENLKPTIDQAENGLKMVHAQFAMNLGLPYNTRFELEPAAGGVSSLPLDLQELITRAASGKPDILELQKNIAVLQSGRKAQALQLYTPFIRLSWNLSSTFNPQLDPWKDELFNGDNWNKGGSFSLTLGMSLNNLFPFTKEGQGLKDTDNSLRGLNIALAQAVWGTELEIYNTVLSLERIRTTIEAQNLTVELAERTYELTETAYRAGLNDLLEVQNAELELRRARGGVSEQNYNYLMGLTDLEYAIGAPFGSLLGRN